MKLKLFILIALVGFSSLAAQAQKKPVASKKAPVVTIKKCGLPSDSANSAKLPLATILAWADQPALVVKCSDGKSYTLHQFGVSIIYKSPMQVKDFGVGNDAIPYLARKAADKLAAGDTFYLKDIVGLDENKKEVKLPGLAFSVSE
ncbi:MAG TPA: hypothetical protein PLH61_04280 [Bacteroidia bacterium]|jgi:hypothetical protein|nr:hypothetical protein [Bacteroidia bacterium]HQK97216.1 hypothetical protein [Bacteroidia bacterium]